MVLCLCLPLAIGEAEKDMATSVLEGGTGCPWVKGRKARHDVGLAFPRADGVRLGLPLVAEGPVGPEHPGWEGHGLGMSLHPG